ncbi:MAG: bifunctional oligoribonuclease/PAP phosphatase NrnA [Bacteroidia bacterium]|nr:bifunctional oligoribonuclease/PAP phosphatase NrnA [Bacteroidia bacterium]MDW8159704.1 bifunctional oligoribonuclease/PAP phosphatase NrnA [Bacteroidia bacterium]
MEITPEFDSFIRNFFKQRRKIVIIPHLNPDGDALGATQALFSYYKKQGHRVWVISPDAPQETFHWMPGFNEIIIANQDLEKAKQTFEEAEVLFCLDFGSAARAGILENLITESSQPSINIDHHLDSAHFTTYRLHDVKACSTCELVYRFILYQNGRITPEVATCIYTGILTDTGSFRFRNVTPEVHRIVAELIEKGAQTDLVHNKIYYSNTVEKTRFMGYCLYERLKILPQLHTAYITVPLSLQQDMNYRVGDTQGLVMLTLSLKNINLGIVLVENEELIRMSFRSVGSFAANKLAARFNGGGHYNAAGAKSYSSLEETEKQLLAVLEEYKQELDYEIYDQVVFFV